MQNRRDAGLEGCRKGRMNEMRNAELVLPWHLLKKDNKFNLLLLHNILTCYDIIFHRKYLSNPGVCTYCAEEGKIVDINV